MASDRRHKAACLPTRLIVLDYDKLAEGHDLIERLKEKKLEALYWPTHSSTPEAPRLRVVIELDREVTREEYSILWERVDKEIGLPGDRTARYSGQPMFCPARGADISRLKGAPYKVGRIDVPTGDASLAPGGLLTGRVNPGDLKDTDRKVLEKLRKEFPHLYRREDGRDLSEDDFALVSQLAKWTHGDARRIDRIARATEMWRKKWDTRRGDTTWLAYTMRDQVRAPFEMPKIESLAAVERRSVKPISWLITGLIARGSHTLWIGRPKTGKSTILRQAMLAAAGVRPLWRSWESSGFTIPETSRVLYLELEMADSILKAELEALKVPGWPDTVFRLTKFPSFDDDGLDLLRRVILEHRIDWVIVDSWIRVEPEVPRSMSLFKGQAFLFQRVTDLAHELDINITSVVHGGKREDNDNPEMIIAATSAVLGSADDFVVTIVPPTNDEESTRRVLFLRGRNYRHAGVRYGLDRVDGRMEMLGRLSNVDRVENETAILELLTHSTTPLSLADIAEALNRSRPNVRRSIRRLIETNRVVQDGRHTYRMAD